MPKQKLELVTVALIFTILGLVYTYPLVLYFNQGMPYTHSPAKGYEVVPLVQGDHLQLYYKFWLFKDSVLGKTPLFSDPYHFNITDTEKKDFATQFLPLSFFFLLLSIFGDNFAYNALVVLSFTFSGLAMYLLVKFYTKNKFSAFLGGLIFALAPFRLAQLLGGHPNGFLFFLIPLTIYFFELSLSRQSIKYALFFGISLFSLALLESHLIYYTFLLLIPLIFLRTFFLINKGKGWWKGFLAILLVMILCLAWLLPTSSASSPPSIGERERTLVEVRIFSPRIGDIFKRNNDDSERYIYLGIFPLLLAFFGFFSNLFGRGMKKEKWWTNLFYGFVLFITFILCLGPSLDNIFPLHRLCYEYIPYFNFPRVPGRIIVLSFLSLSLLAGFGVARIYKIEKKIKFLVLAILTLGILGEFYPFKARGISLTPKGKNRVYEIVKENIGDYKLLELPIWPGDTSWSTIYLYYNTKTRAKMINGYSSYVSKDYVKNIFWPLYNLNLGEMREEQYRLLKRLRVKYIIMHEEAFPPKVSPYPFSFSLNNLKNSRYVKFIEQEDPVWLFELLDEPSESLPQVFFQSCPVGKVYEAEKLPRRVGTVQPDPEASGGYAVYGDITKDRADHLVFGPYRVFPTGKYKVIFRLKVDDNLTKEPVARIDVATDKGENILAEKIIRGTDFKASNAYQDFPLTFTASLKKLYSSEFRVYFYKRVNLWADYTYLLFAKEKDPKFSYQAGELFHIARVKFDPQASGGSALLAEVAKDPKDRLTWGPYRRYPPGDYTASFRLKLEDLVLKEEVARIEVIAPKGTRLATKTLRGRDFPTNTYQEFTLSYSLERPTILEFLTFFSKRANLWVDEIEISKK